MNVQQISKVQVEDISLRCELAQRISGHAKAPEQALKFIFKSAMSQLEEISENKFDSSMKERVWNAVSKERLITINETFIMEFCDKILGSFDDNEVSAMLEEHKLKGMIQTLKYSAPLNEAFALSQDAIINVVINKANSMTDAWIHEIVEAVRKEGIVLPERK